MTALPGWRIRGQGAARLADCGLIIPTYRREVETVSLLGLLSRFHRPPAEVVVVDGDTGGNLETMLRVWGESRSPAAFDLLYVRGPRGLTRQRNAGIDVSSGRYVFFLDDDSRPLPGYFEAVRKAFLDDPEVGAVAGSVINEMDRPPVGRWRLRYALGLAPPVEPMMYHPSGTSAPRALMKPFTGVRPVDVLPGCAFAVRRDVLDRCRFSEFFEGYSQGEDLEMSLRIGRKWRIVCCGDAHVRHEAAPGARPTSFVKGRMEVRNRYFIWKRHSPGAAIRDRGRFWLDHALILAMDFGWLIRQPWRSCHLSHAAGVFAGALECCVRPPRYQEPPPGSCYRLAERHELTASPGPGRS